MAGPLFLRMLYPCVLILMTIAFNGLYFSRTIPISEGWGVYYAELIRRGLFPYRDFYYYLPPLNLLIDTQIWSLSGGLLIVYRSWRLLERVLLVLLVYVFLKSCGARRGIAFVAALFGSIIGAGSVYDLIGDYNQTAILLIVVLGILLLKFIEAETNRQKSLAILLLGTFWSILFLLKQSSGAAVALVFLMIFIIYLLHSQDRNWLQETALLVTGITLPLLALALVLYCNGALGQFVDQVFLAGGGAKGGVLTVLTEGMLAIFGKNSEIGIVFCMFMIAVILGDAEFNSIIHGRKRDFVLLVLTIALLAILFINSYGSYCVSAIRYFFDNKVASLLFVSVIVSIMLVGYKYLRLNYTHLAILMTIGGLIVALCIAYTNFRSAASHLYESGLFGLMDSFCIIIDIFTVLCFFRSLYLYLSNDGHCATYQKDLMVSGCAFAACYSGLMTASSSGTPPYVLFLVAPVCIMNMLTAKIADNHIKIIRDVVILGVCVVICATIFAQKSTHPYSWWNAEGTVSDDVVAIDSGFLKGFDVSRKQLDTFDRVVKIIEDNSDEDDIVWGFPYVKLFNLMTGRISEPGFVPVPFYDVCPDKYAKNEALLLSQNPPDIVVWKDIPGCIEVHEKYFRNGNPLGQRDIVSWFGNAVDNGEYIEIGRIDGIYIYKRRQSGRVGYTYYDDSIDENVSLMEDRSAE